MRTTSLVPVLAALISIASTFSISYGANQGGRVAARDAARVRSPATPANFVARAKPSAERRNYVPRQAPSARHVHRDHIPRAAPSARQNRRNYVPRAQPSATIHPRAEPSGVHHRRGRDEHVPRHKIDHTKRSSQDQNVFGNKIGLGWDEDEDQCPAPLSACPVRGTSDADAIECVDLYSDLYSCGGCAADNIAYDCNAIPYARSVECDSGSCKVHSCVEGYVVAPPHDVCVPVGAQ